MKRDPTSPAESDVVDPWFTDLLGPLVQLVGSVNDVGDIANLLTVACTGSAAAHAIYRRMRSRRKAVAASIKGMRSGLGRTQAALQSLSAMPDIAELVITRRRIGFSVRTNAYHAYKKSVEEIHRGITELATHAEVIWRIRDEVPKSAYESAGLSDDAAKLADRLGDALKTLAGLHSPHEAKNREHVKELIHLARTFCEHAQSKLDGAERLSFERDAQ